MECRTTHRRRVFSQIARALAIAGPVVTLMTASIGAAIATEDTFTIGGKDFAITIYPGPADGKKYPMLVLLHGNIGLVGLDGKLNLYGRQMNEFAQELSQLNYVTAVPSYYAMDDQDHQGHLKQQDPVPHVPTLAAAIKMLVDSHPEADPNRLGLVGYSLGAATAMSYTVSGAEPAAKVLVDYFGPVAPVVQGAPPGNSAILDGVDRFPPTIIFHNKKDFIVPSSHSEELDRRLAAPHRLKVYETESPLELLQGNHAFAPGGELDVDSRKLAIDWLLEHLAPIPM